MWIVFGTKSATTRVPGGLKVERTCSQCGETATFYEKQLTSTFRLYFIDVFDYRRHRVMACGCCGATFATDELGMPPLQSDAEPPVAQQLGEHLGRAATTVGDYADRAAAAVQSGVSGLLSNRRSPPAAPAPRRDGAAPPGPREEDPIDDVDIDALMDDPMEARFRELEKKAREGSK